MIYGDTWDNGIDLMAVHRAATDPGPCPELTDEEQKRAVVVMTENGKSLTEIGSRLGVDPRTVDRWRGEMGCRPCSG
ncbi:helix-turn-helix domain-containing protein [Streptomyces vinaceus]|uniref:helix-turn-helix domain-containing protein n=1 Tax=Streptomyces vinaceus TaxID=1960 RepID=UPI0036B3BFC1